MSEESRPQSKTANTETKPSKPTHKSGHALPLWQEDHNHPSSREESSFKKLEKEFFFGWLKRNPTIGSNLGLHQFDEEMPAGDAEKIEDDIKFLKSMLGKFQKVNIKRLAPERKIDQKLTVNLINGWLFELDELRLWERRPEAPRFIGECIYQLLGRNYAPLKKRLVAIISRLRKLPRFIRHSLSKLKDPCKDLIEIELETVTRLPGFFFSLKELCRENTKASEFREISKAISEIQNALDYFCESLIIDSLPEARDRSTIQPSQFKKMIRLAMIDEDPNNLIKLANKRFDHLEIKLKELGSRIKRRTNIEDVRDIVKSKHPTDFRQVTDFVRETIKKLKDFIAKTDFATIPRNGNLYLVDTPQYLRHFYPIGAYWCASKFEKTQDGYYFLTPSTVDENKLREQNFATLTNLTTHETYPGLHMMYICSNTNKSLVRSLSWPAQTTQGWASYCEQQIFELGFDRSIEAEFVKTINEIWRVARVIIDIQLSTGRMSQKESVAYLVENTGLDWSSAEAEIRRYMISPSIPLAGFLGTEKILQMKKYMKEHLQDKYTDKLFHEIILYNGNLPLKLMQKEIDHVISSIIKKH